MGLLVRFVLTCRLLTFGGDLGMLIVHCWGDLDMPLVHVWGWSSLVGGDLDMPLVH